MNTLIDRALDVAQVCSYTCTLGRFFVMPLTLPMPIFEKISLQGALEKFDKNRVLHKKSFLCNTRFLSNFYRAPYRDNFSKIGMGNVRGITKNVPNLQVYEHTPETPTTPSIKVVKVVLYYLIGCVKYIVPVCM